MVMRLPFNFSTYEIKWLRRQYFNRQHPISLCIFNGIREEDKTMMKQMVRGGVPPCGYLLLLTLSWLLFGCSTLSVPQSPPISLEQPIALLPLANLSQTPLAGVKVEQTLLSILHERQIPNRAFPRRRQLTLSDILSEEGDKDQQVKWLGQHQFDYVLSGSVNEWGYSKGLAGDPSISITLVIYRADRPEEVLWRATGSKVGLGYKNLSSLSQEILLELLKGVAFQHG